MHMDALLIVFAMVATLLAAALTVPAGFGLLSLFVRKSFPEFKIPEDSVKFSKRLGFDILYLSVRWESSTLRLLNRALVNAVVLGLLDI